MQALRKDPLTVYGDGKQTRSFQFVSDLVYFFMAPFLHVQIFIELGIDLEFGWFYFN
jgi:UDP-glucuronate decarboxylase